MWVKIHSQLRTRLRANYLRDRRVEELIANECLTPDALHARQEVLLVRSLEAAKKHLEAYEDLAAPEGDVFRLLETLPIITKSDLLSNAQSYVPALGLKRLWTPRGLTSGTTGTPLEVFRSLDSIVWESAFLQRHWGWSGFAKGMKRATLRGDNVAAATRSTKPFWQYNNTENQLLLSSRHLRPPFIDSIVNELRRFAPYLLQAYPSTAFELARHLERAGEYLHIPFVYTSSEVLYPHQRELIRSRIKSKVIDLYGMAERVAFITECESGNYHVNTDYSYVEIVDETGKPTNKTGYIVGTTFHNLTMPLLRYRLSDQTCWKSGVCPCGRTYPMVEQIKGKFEDVIYGSRGDPISPSIITFAFKGLHNIEKSQVAQVADGHWEIRVVPLTGYGPAERSEIIKNIRELVDPDLKVTVVEYRDIPRTQAGKYRWVVNEWLNQTS